MNKIKIGNSNRRNKKWQDGYTLLLLGIDKITASKPLLLTKLWFFCSSGLPTQVRLRLVGTCEVVPQDDSASVDMEITAGSFHASFVAIRQL